MPTTLVGLLLFVVLLAPGFCYVLRKELGQATRTVSPFRETVTLAAISLACDAAVAAVFGVVRILLPNRTPDIGALVRQPAAYARAHYASLGWWSLGLLAAACLFAVALASTNIGDKAAAMVRHIWDCGGSRPLRTRSPSTRLGGGCSTSSMTASSMSAATSRTAASCRAGSSATPRTTERPLIGI